FTYLIRRYKCTAAKFKSTQPSALSIQPPKHSCPNRLFVLETQACVLLLLLVYEPCYACLGRDSLSPLRVEGDIQARLPSPWPSAKNGEAQNCPFSRNPRLYSLAPRLQHDESATLDQKLLPSESLSWLRNMRVPLHGLSPKLSNPESLSSCH